jgi:hypothetical protein
MIASSFIIQANVIMIVNYDGKTFIVQATAISFSSQFTNGHNKLEYFNMPGWKCLPMANTPAYRASLVMKKMKCCEYGPWCRIHHISFSL